MIFGLNLVNLWVIGQLHLHAATDAPLNVTFIRAPSHALLKVDVPLVFRGEDVSPGLRKGKPACNCAFIYISYPNYVLV